MKDKNYGLSEQIRFQEYYGVTIENSKERNSRQFPFGQELQEEEKRASFYLEK